MKKVIIVLLTLITLDACKKEVDTKYVPAPRLPIREYLIGGWMSKDIANDWIFNDSLDLDEAVPVNDQDYYRFISFRNDGSCRDSSGIWGFESGVGILTGTWELSSNEKFLITKDSAYTLSLKVYSYGPLYEYGRDALVLEDTTTPKYAGTGVRWMIYERYPFK